MSNGLDLWTRLQIKISWSSTLCLNASPKYTWRVKLLWWSTFNKWSMCVRLKFIVNDLATSVQSHWFVYTIYILLNSPVIWSYNQSTQIACHISVLPSQTYQQIQCNRHGLMLLWFKDLMNVTKEVIIYRSNVLTLLSSAFIRVDLIAATRGPFIRSLIGCLFSDEV